VVFTGVFERAFYYLFDINMGVFVYYAPLFCLFRYSFTKAIKEKSIDIILKGIVFF